MHNSESILRHFFEGSKIKIPIYQRNYDWRKDNCERLFRDIEDNVKNLGTKRMHFFGSIIYMIDQNTGKFQIIDGQQRIVTTALLLAAIRDLLKSGDIVSEDPGLASKIDGMLVNSKHQAFIEPVKKDVDAYNAIILGRTGDNVWGSNLQTNYELFKKMLRSLDGNIAVDDLYRSIEGFQVIVIMLNNQDDDPQAVFESINSTGLRLNEGDKIRNFLLMNLEPEKLDELYDEYWAKIENNVGDLSAFFKDYLTAMEGKVPVSNHVYQSFQEYVGNMKGDTEGMFKELLSYSEIYRAILSHDLSTVSIEASRIMHRINHMGYTVSYPFIMRILDAQRSGRISESDTESILEAVENYLIRRAICDAPTNALKAVLNTLFADLDKQDTSTDAPGKVRHILFKKEKNQRYPRDLEVIDGLSKLDIYKSKKLCSCLLSILEGRNKDSGDILTRIESKDPSDRLTIEHVMPQNETEEWRAEIGDRYDEIHDEWLHRLGNLTLTSYNSEFGCRSFAEKKNLQPGGLGNSPLNLNQCFRTIDTWDENAIMKRNEELVEEFVKAMPELTLGFIPSGKLELTLDNDSEAFNKFVVEGYSFRGNPHGCRNGVEAYLGLMKELYDCDPGRMVAAANKKAAGTLGNRLRHGSTSDAGYKEFVPGLYVSTGMNQPEKVKLLRKAAKLQGVDPTELAFIGYYKPSEQDEAADRDVEEKNRG